MPVLAHGVLGQLRQVQRVLALLVLKLQVATSTNHKAAAAATHSCLAAEEVVRSCSIAVCWWDHGLHGLLLQHQGSTKARRESYQGFGVRHTGSQRALGSPGTRTHHKAIVKPSSRCGDCWSYHLQGTREPGNQQENHSVAVDDLDPQQAPLQHQLAMLSWVKLYTCDLGLCGKTDETPLLGAFETHKPDHRFPSAR